MTTGTKSLLFGVHQFFWHPFTVWMAWIYLYRKLPNWRETLCIFVHDWGYWNCRNMDRDDGESHPEAGAYLLHRWYPGDLYSFNLCLYHSRHYARDCGRAPSQLCWADKASIKFEPCWFYLLRAKLSGELQEYREASARCGLVPLKASNKEWFQIVQNAMINLAQQQNPEAIPYQNEE